MSAPAAGSSGAASPGSSRPLPGAAADSERRVQPRHFHFGPNPAAASGSGDGAAAQADRPPPAAGLYRHALESIFAFLDQRELVTALQVSSSWLAAVESMASLRLTVRKPSVLLRVLAVSAMGHHVTQIGSVDKRMPVTADSLLIVARLMPQLRRLSCDLQLTPAQGQLTFPRGLRLLHLGIVGSPAAADVSAALRVVSRLPMLEFLGISLNDFDEQLSFAPLATLPQLRDLSIRAPPHRLKLTDAQVAQLRAMPLLQRLVVRPISTPLLRRLLAQPHDLRWQKIELPEPLDDEVAALLPQLPSQIALVERNTAVTCSRFDFLRQLPKLTHAYLQVRGPSVAGRMESLMAGLQCCSRMENLDLGSTEISAAHLAGLLPRLPRLRKLHLSHSRITTLAFLAQPPLTDQLTVLQLIACRQLPLTELRHVHALRALKSLWLIESLTAPMDAHCRSLYTPPSLLMPQLQKFFYKP